MREATNADCERVREIVFGVLEEYGLSPEPQGIDRDLEDIEASYLRRGGTFDVLVGENGTIVGTVGLYPIDGSTVELRKMYFLKQIRGKGLGKALLSRTVERARELGFERITLETASVLKEAIGLYTSFGFTDQPGFHADRCDRGFYLDLERKE
ncbi:MAG: GNAT family N-acetyltransferase [Acidobacteriota bacterium]|nr:MAG: GNAT family N-acetyltransferase [Acidobacteriota bacterium]